MEQQKDTKVSNKDISLSYNKGYLSSGTFDAIYLHLHKKTEKIVAAVFLITDILSDRSPLRHRVQISAVDTLSFMFSSSRSLVTDSVPFVSQYVGRLLEIQSLLEVAFLAGQLSEMNFKVISVEIEKAISVSESLKMERGPGSSKVSEVLLSGSSEARKDAFSSGVYIKSHVLHPDSYKGHRIGHVKGHKAAKKRERTRVESFIGKGQRGETIISLLADGRKLTIKDIAGSIKDLSEKTIQRELSSMVRSGVLKKEGQRRWSRYCVAAVPANASSSTTGPGDVGMA